MSLLSDTWAAAARERAAHPALAEARRALDAAVASYHTLLPEIPERQAGYYHDFFCPEHAVQLVFDPRGPHRHVCPVDQKVYSGEPFDSAWRWSVNHVLSVAALKCAFRGFLSGAEPDGARAAEILLGYADRYRTFPQLPPPPWGRPGVVAWQLLDESVWVIRMAWAWALLRDTLPPDAAERIRSGLLRPAADYLFEERSREIHNSTNWLNAALVTLALAIDDAALLADTLDGPGGVRAQLAQGVRADGFWWEGSLSYHYYALAALVWTIRSLRASGQPFGGDDVVHQMLRAPIAIALPDLTLPATNDCWYFIGLTGETGHDIPNAAGFYEVGHGWYADPLFAWVLQQNYRQRPRVAFEALLDGTPTLPAGPEPTFGHNHAAPSGFAVLRSSAPRAEQTYLLLKAAPDGGGHGHPDQLGLSLFAHGERLAPDLGTPGYGIALNETWYRQTASHCTALVDDQSQPLGTGRIDRFEVRPDFTLIDASTGWTTADGRDVRLRRLILWRDTYFVDVFLDESPTSHQVDWIYHNTGVLTGGPASEPVAASLGGDGGYGHLTDVRRLRGPENVQLRWLTGNAQLDLFFPLPEGGDLFLASGPANPASETLSVAIRRQTGARLAFLAVFVPAKASQDPPVRRVQWSEGETGELSIETTAGTEKWSIGPEWRDVDLRE